MEIWSRENFFWTQNKVGKVKRHSNDICFIIKSNFKTFQSSNTIPIFTKKVKINKRERKNELHPANDQGETQVLKFNSKIELCLKITGGISFCNFYINTKKPKLFLPWSFLFFLCFTFLTKILLWWWGFIIINSYWPLKFVFFFFKKKTNSIVISLRIFLFLQWLTDF